jgi:GNAT superfamily N-acetyltransferase
VALFVDRNVRRQGVGEALMEWAERIGAGRGVTALFAHSNPTASAARFYMKRGFEIVGLTSKEIVRSLSGDITLAKRIGVA